MTNANFQDLSNMQFNRLYVMRISHKRGKRTYFKCLCDCGTIKAIRSDKLKEGSTISCGCYNKEILSETHSGKNNFYYGVGPMLGKRGSKHPAWKGGKRTEQEIIRDKIRETILKDVYDRDTYTCQKCNCHKRNLNGHHIFDFANYISLRTEKFNIITLCVACHKEFHKIYPVHLTNNLDDLELFLGNKYKFRNELMEIINAS